MENFNPAIASIGFWIFIGMVVVGGIWDSIRKRDAEHETMRRIIESGRDLDPDLIETLMGTKKLHQGLKVGGWIVLACAPGMAILALFISWQASGFLLPLLGVAGLLVCIGGGLLYAGKMVEAEE